MDEETLTINEKTRNEKIKIFFLNNKKLFLTSILIIILLILSFYIFQIYKDNQKEQISNKYNNSIIEYNINDKTKTALSMKEIVENKDSTYSPLALYFIIDNNLIENKNEIKELFDILIYKTSLDAEIKNLIIYKKGLFYSDTKKESELLNILNPLINSNSIWKSHALYLIAEYFYSKNEKQKAKEFFNQILSTPNANQDIISEAQKRLIRDLSE